MTCENCGEREAEIHLTQIVDDEMTTVHLCSRCAEEQGYAESSEPAAEGGASVQGENVPLTDFLAQMGKGGGEESMLPAPSEPCPYCGTTIEDFRKTGRLGCPQCYPHYEAQLRPLLRRLHGSTQHVGKLYVGSDSEEEDRHTRLSALRRKLDRAVETEDFEKAAELRDRIEEMEGEPETEPVE